jgi:hypothetical protein
MRLHLTERIGDGGFADIWRAKDELDRNVAVKIVRTASEGISNALAHAKALARATHANVVMVHTIDRVQDPDSGAEVDCVVMELLEGETLAKCFKGAKFSLTEAQKLGVGLINGISHIHQQGMAHGDLHEENVMVVDSIIKIIDILYLNTLLILTTEHRDVRLRRDLVALRLLLQQIIVHSDLDSAEASEFNNLLELNASCDMMRQAFMEITNPDTSKSSARAFEHAFNRVIDSEYIEGATYAAALIDETPKPVTLLLLKEIVAKKVCDKKHRAYVQALWGRLQPSERIILLADLNVAIDAEVPKGQFWPLLRMLGWFGVEGWNGLSSVVQLRVENALTKDVLAGHKDIHQGHLKNGILGTWAITFWMHFRNPHQLADNLISLLRQNWYTQNYVGESFLLTIPPLADKTNKRAEFIGAFRIAVANDARIVVNELGKLPADWVSEIRA